MSGFCRCIVASLGLSALFLAPALRISHAQASNPQQNPGTPAASGFKPQLIGLYLRVEDAQGRFVGNLVKENFYLFVDGKPREPESASTNDSLPCSVVLLLDWSGSRRAELPRAEIKPAIDMFRSILGPNCHASAAQFTYNVFPLTGPTNDPNEMESRLKKGSEDPPRSSTALYDATTWAALKLSRARGYRVIIIVSDGEDNASRSQLGNAVRNVREANSTVYFLSLNSFARSEPKKLRKETQLFIQQVTDPTGGEAFAIHTEQDMNAAFQRIKERLSHYYSLSFWTVPEDVAGRLHSLRVEMEPNEIRIRAAEGFWP